MTRSTAADLADVASSPTAAAAAAAAISVTMALIACNKNSKQIIFNRPAGARAGLHKAL